VSGRVPGVTQVQVCAGPAEVEVRTEPVGDLRDDDRVVVGIAGLLTSGGAPDVLRQYLSRLAAERAEQLAGAG